MKTFPLPAIEAWMIQTCPSCGHPFRTPVAGKKSYATECIDCAEGEKSSNLRAAAQALGAALLPGTQAP